MSDDIISHVTETIKSGGVVPEDYQRVESGKILILGDMADIDFEVIQDFYQQREKTNE